MAEFVMKDIVRKAGLEDLFEIESAATSTEEIGNEVYPPAKRKLAEHGIGCKGKTARQMTHRDYDHFDLLIGMDSWNFRNMNRICGGDPEMKIRLLMDFTDDPAMWLTPGIQVTLRPHGVMCQKAVSSYSITLFLFNRGVLELLEGTAELVGTGSTFGTTTDAIKALHDVIDMLSAH